MDYVVLVKEIADPEGVVFDEQGLPDPKSRLIANPRDLNALEAALTLRKDGEKVLAVSVGYQRGVLEESVAIGADHGYLIDTDAESWDSATASKGIASLVKKLLADGTVASSYLVLAGSAGEDYDNSQAAIRVAELLGIPHLAYCETISLDGSLTAKVNAVGGYAQVTSPTPALLTVTETANQPRYASVQRKLKAKRDQSFYTTVKLDELGVTASEKVELIATALPKEKPAAKVFSDADAGKNVAALLKAMQDDGRPLGGSR